MKTSTTILALFALLLISCNAQTYTALTQAQIASNTQVQALIQTGLAQVITLGQQKNYFNSTNFTVTKINSVSKAVVTNGNSYKIDVNYTNTANEIVQAKFTGLYNTKTNKTSISTLSFTLQYPPKSVPVTPGPATSVDVNHLQTDAALKSLFDFGLKTTIQNGINSGHVPQDTYTVTKVNSIAKQDSQIGPIYTFTCVANNSSKKTTLTLSFSIASQTQQLTAYSIKVQTTL